MKQKLWYLRFETRSWTQSTQTFSAAECGAHINMIAWSWEGGAVPDDDEVIVRVARAPLAVALKVLSSKWSLDGDGWRNPRLEEERSATSARSDSASVASSRRWNHQSADANSMRTRCGTNAEPHAESMRNASETPCGIDAIHSHSHSHSHSQNQTTTCEPKTSSARTKKVPSVQYSGGVWTVGAEDRARWSAAYPAVDIDQSLARMSAWLEANPTKAKRSNWSRFATNWLAKSQDRGGESSTVRYTRPVESNF